MTREDLQYLPEIFVFFKGGKGVEGEGVFLGNPEGFRLGRLGNLRED